MKKYLLTLLILMLILCGCHGCSFIKERFGIKQNSNQEEQFQDEAQPQEEKKSEPIPVNPQHS